MITRLETSQTQIEASICRDHGLPPESINIFWQLDHLEQQFTSSPNRVTFARLKGAVKTVVDQTHGLSEQWAPYFRGRSFALLPKSKWLSAGGVARFLQRDWKVDISRATVMSSLQYYNHYCVKFPALPWTFLSYSTMVEVGTKLSEDERFQKVMKSLALVVLSERQQARQDVVMEEAVVGEEEHHGGEEDDGEEEDEMEDHNQASAAEGSAPLWPNVEQLPNTYTTFGR